MFELSRDDDAILMSSELVSAQRRAMTRRLSGRKPSGRQLCSWLHTMGGAFEDDIAHGMKFYFSFRILVTAEVNRAIQSSPYLGIYNLRGTLCELEYY